MNIEITGLGPLKIQNIFIDYNGTIAKDGLLLDGMIEALDKLSESYKVYIITGDTYGTVKKAFEDTSIRVILASTSKEKETVIKKYSNTLSIGNGSIDHLMFQASDLAFCVIGPEGASFKAIKNADIVLTSIHHVFEMIEDPNKIIATLKE